LTLVAMLIDFPDQSRSNVVSSVLTVCAVPPTTGFSVISSRLYS
jgi:hypothetical protein